MNVVEFYLLAVPFLFLGFGVTIYLAAKRMADAEDRRHRRPAE
ncbi:MAG TPA: hypothetical protein VLA00_00190 [Xanthobacteraceae bacterium]|nr:hypothetical protein [Xanthobacteraceae bacterium]